MMHAWRSPPFIFIEQSGDEHIHPSTSWKPPCRVAWVMQVSMSLTIMCDALSWQVNGLMFLHANGIRSACIAVLYALAADCQPV